MREEINRQIISGTISGSAFIAGTNAGGGTDVNSIPMLIAKDPTATATIHSIAQGSEAWWRNQLQTASGLSTRATLKARAMRLWMDCAKGSGRLGPDIGLTDQRAYETLELSFDDQKRITSEDSVVVKLGYDNFKLKGAAVMWDEMVPDINTPANEDTGTKTTSTLFFLNTEFLRWVVDSETDFIVTPFVEPVNQTAMTSKMLFMGQMIVCNRRKHGVMHSISQSITT